MTYKKAYIIITLFYMIAVGCFLIIENPTLKFFFILGGIVLSSLLKGYAKDNENQQKKTQ